MKGWQDDDNPGGELLPLLMMLAVFGVLGVGLAVVMAPVIGTYEAGLRALLGQ